MATLLGQSATLAASTVTTFTFNSVLATGVFGPNATPCVKVLLFNNQAGAVDVWASLDGTTPTVAGSNEVYVPANAVVTETIDAPSNGTVTVKAISSGTPKMVVEVR